MPPTGMRVYFQLEQSNIFCISVLEAVEIFNGDFVEQVSLRELPSPVMKVIRSYRFHLLQNPLLQRFPCRV